MNIFRFLEHWLANIIFRIKGTVDHRYNYVHQSTNNMAVLTQDDPKLGCTKVNIVGNLMKFNGLNRAGMQINRYGGVKFCIYAKNNIGGTWRQSPSDPEANFVGDGVNSDARLFSYLLLLCCCCCCCIYI